MSGLAPEMAAILRRLPAIAADPRAVADMPLADARARTRRVWAAYWNAQPPRVARVEDATIDGPHGPIRIRLYQPDGASAETVLYVHGGGFVLGDLDTHDGVVRRLALYSGLCWVSVEYRLAPEHRYPVPLDDCVAAAEWVAARAPLLRFGVAGDSAGANLALAVAMRLRDRGGPVPGAAFLAFGCYDRAMRGLSHVRYGGGDYLLSSTDVEWFWRQYVGDQCAATLPLDADLAGLPAMYVGAAECDPLFDDSAGLAQRLRDADHPHMFRIWRGLTHGCIGMSRDLNAADRILAEAAVWLRAALRPDG